jgi:hypothetical protein
LILELAHQRENFSALLSASAHVISAQGSITQRRAYHFKRGAWMTRYMSAVNFTSWFVTQDVVQIIGQLAEDRDNGALTHVTNESYVFVP